MVMDVMAAAARIEAAGGRVIHMEVGQPAAAAPATAIAAARAALASGRLRYTETLGLPTLRAEGAINRRAASNIVSGPLLPRADPAPLSPHLRAQFASKRSRNQP